MGLEDLIKNARKIPKKYREQALQYAHEKVLSTTPFTRAKDKVIHVARIETMMAIAGGIAGYFAGNALEGAKDGLEIGALGLAGTYAISWFEPQSRAWKELPEYKRSMARMLGDIGNYFENAKNPLKYAAMMTGVSTVLLGLIGIPFAHDENSFGIGALLGLMASAYNVTEENRVIDAVQNYTIILHGIAAEGGLTPFSIDYFR